LAAETEVCSVKSLNTPASRRLFSAILMRYNTAQQSIDR
jgi:predicted membrane-bound spermidine synthase